MKILVLREERPENFYPLTYTRATFEMRYGAWCQLDRAIIYAEKHGLKLALQCRKELEEYLRVKTGFSVNEDFGAGADITYFEDLPAATPWDILEQNTQLISGDWAQWNDVTTHRQKIPQNVYVIGNPDDIHLAQDATVQPGCVLDVTEGPIIIDSGAEVRFSQVQGPVFIGANCKIDSARLRSGTSIGPNCKIGGEVASSIFQSRSNKAHDGFIGHSWIGRWVNLGAMSTTSNLKNTYSNIRYVREESVIIETGAQFLGAIIGDHTKIGVGQLLSTGSNIGVGCNVYGGPVAPKYIPSFCWLGPHGAEEHRFYKCLETVHAVLARRSKKLRPASGRILQRLFNDTADARARFLLHYNVT